MKEKKCHEMAERWGEEFSSTSFMTMENDDFVHNLFE